MKRLIVCAAAAMAGCMTVEPVYTPDGRQGYAVTCNGTARSWNDCLRAAGETCGARGYDVFSQTGDRGWMPVEGTILPTASRQLMFACR